jgi:D-alanyl-D-alanine carboxypeptidase/D-alanyl-D-alanine-endopeptidase (penicillin-binding protein 4)
MRRLLALFFFCSTLLFAGRMNDSLLSPMAAANTARIAGQSSSAQRLSKALAIDSLLSESFFDTTLCGISIYDATGASVLYKKNEKLLLRPASNMKILTSAAALLISPPELCFQTKLYFRGTIRRGILHGDLYIKGGADPEFSLNDIDSLVDALHDTGIKNIKGNIYGDVSFLDSLFWGEGWMWDDDPSTDAPYFSALSLNKNSVTVKIAYIGAKHYMDLNVDPKSAYFHISKHINSSDKAASGFSISRNFIARTNSILVEGTAGNNDTTITKSLNVFNPGLFFLTYFRERLKAADILFRGQTDFSRVPDDCSPVKIISRPIQSVLLPLNKDSDNLDAEMILRLLGSIYHNENISATDGIRAIDSLISWAGFSPANYRIADGSGVSYYNLLSPELLCGVLRALHDREPVLFKKLIDTFPIGNEDGTLKNRLSFTETKGRVKAKTGTLSGASCLSGCVTGTDGHLYLFSIMMQNHVRKTKRAQAFQDKICRILAR